MSRNAIAPPRAAGAGLAYLTLRNLPVRKLLGCLRALGWCPLRRRGSHQVWAAPAGPQVSIVVGHRGRDVSAIVLAAVRRALREAELRVRTTRRLGHGR